VVEADVDDRAGAGVELLVARGVGGGAGGQGRHVAGGQRIVVDAHVVEGAVEMVAERAAGGLGADEQRIGRGRQRAGGGGGGDQRAVDVQLDGRAVVGAGDFVEDAGGRQRGGAGGADARE